MFTRQKYNTSIFKITLYTFKKLCVILNNKKTKLLYDYIFIIEENINRYKDNIIESLKIIN